MNPNFYSVLDSRRDGIYRFETVESGGRLGVRCVVYLHKSYFFEDILNKYENTKYAISFKHCLYNRFSAQETFKFENIVWCWPYDEFDFDIGVQMSKERIDKKIQSKKKRIQKYIKHLELHNVRHKKKNMINN